MNQNEKALADCRKAFEEKFKDRVHLLRCFKMNGNEVLDELEDRYTRADANLAWDAFRDAWFAALESQPVAGQVSGEVERAFQALEMHGVPRERAVTVANGIEVLATRFNRAIRTNPVADQVRWDILKELAESSEAVNSHLLKIGTGDEWERIWTRWRIATEEALRTAQQPKAQAVEVSRDAVVKVAEKFLVSGRPRYGKDHAAIPVSDLQELYDELYALIISRQEGR